PALKQIADSIARESGAALAITAEPIAGVHGADALVSSPWDPSFMAGEYSVEERLLKETGNSECIFFHNIPCARRLGVSNGVAESAQSRIFQLAQNQRYVARAILQTIL
ncbi:MAG: hypothetical protein LLF89_03495, partial [Spirochaetaceae bacterium]|nr:hypothetical protein [Spirochaetaceae bacterium]